MSRWTLTLLLILIALVFFYAFTGQEVQSHEVTFLFGGILGFLLGSWTGGWRVLRKQLRGNIQKARDTFRKDKEGLL